MKTIQTKPDNTTRGNIIWIDPNKTKAGWEPNPEGKYIMGCDPYYLPTWWEKILIWLRLKKSLKPTITYLSPLPKDFIGTDKSNMKIKN